ncbi:histidine phosphatase family protein [Salisediminibacterium selenitireducens]|uniref:Phosphoglycerate mutase n=1 Tax=Bacillus selenitireducens (strain ATCC 700615 / DSM 15326 / MLS10) TaxID=439292 RepID=D6XYI5_BACIE|nr:histidine phosphatase family protein [Salisediminibacterium selenitireducens]ADI00254.1 Phosphoglycerate mutase [[Bacillus] selenitireducens MLS10]
MDTEQTVYFIRHGQSEANKQGIIQGHAEFPLTDLGETQATLAGEWFTGIKLNRIITSDLQRASDTAKAISRHQKNDALKTERNLLAREVGLGPLEGKTREEMGSLFPEMKPEQLLTSGISGTETVDAITRRCQLLEQTLTEGGVAETAVVSHGGFISIYLMYLIAGEDWHRWNRPFVIGNTGITKITYNSGQAKIHFTNKQEHLEGRDGLTSSTVVY